MIITHVQRISLWFVVLLAFANAHEPKSSSSEDVFGEYCFAKEKSKEGTIWKWKKYKGNQSYLFSYIPCAYKYKYSFSPDDGITCPKTTKLEYTVEWNREIQIIGNERIISVTLTINSIALSENKAYYVNEGYVFFNGYIATELDALMMKYHELGHVYYNECINWPVYSKDYTIKMKKGDCDIQRAVNEKGSEFVKLVEKKTKKLLERSSELFHEKYGHSGSKEYTDDGDKVTSPKDYVCPNELRFSSNTLE